MRVAVLLTALLVGNSVQTCHGFSLGWLTDSLQAGLDAEFRRAYKAAKEAAEDAVSDTRNTLGNFGLQSSDKLAELTQKAEDEIDLFRDKARSGLKVVEQNVQGGLDAVQNFAEENKFIQTGDDAMRLLGTDGLNRDSLSPGLSAARGLGKGIVDTAQNAVDSITDLSKFQNGIGALVITASEQPQSGIGGAQNSLLQSLKAKAEEEGEVIKTKVVSSLGKLARETMDAKMETVKNLGRAVAGTANAKNAIEKTFEKVATDFNTGRDIMANLGGNIMDAVSSRLRLLENLGKGGRDSIDDGSQVFDNMKNRIARAIGNALATNTEMQRNVEEAVNSGMKALQNLAQQNTELNEKFARIRAPATAGARFLADFLFKDDDRGTAGEVMQTLEAESLEDFNTPSAEITKRLDDMDTPNIDQVAENTEELDENMKELEDKEVSDTAATETEESDTMPVEVSEWTAGDQTLGLAETFDTEPTKVENTGADEAQNSGVNDQKNLEKTDRDPAGVDSENPEFFQENTETAARPNLFGILDTLHTLHMGPLSDGISRIREMESLMQGNIGDALNLIQDEQNEMTDEVAGTDTATNDQADGKESPFAKTEATLMSDGEVSEVEEMEDPGKDILESTGYDVESQGMNDKIPNSIFRFIDDFGDGASESEDDSVPEDLKNI